MHVLQLCLRGGSDDLDGGLSTLTTVLCMCSLSLVLLITFCFIFQDIARELVLSGWEYWAWQRGRGILILAIKNTLFDLHNCLFILYDRRGSWIMPQLPLLSQKSSHQDFELGIT